jgi:hypothetical protein
MLTFRGMLLCLSGVVVAAGLFILGYNSGAGLASWDTSRIARFSSCVDRLKVDDPRQWASSRETSIRKAVDLLAGQDDCAFENGFAAIYSNELRWLTGLRLIPPPPRNAKPRAR